MAEAAALPFLYLAAQRTPECVVRNTEESLQNLVNLNQFWIVIILFPIGLAPK